MHIAEEWGEWEYLEIFPASQDLCGAITDINLTLFPFLVSILQLAFLSFGAYLGIHIRNFCKLPQNVWSVLSGILLIFIGLFKFVAF